MEIERKFLIKSLPVKHLTSPRQLRYIRWQQPRMKFVYHWDKQGKTSPENGYFCLLFKFFIYFIN